MLSDCVFQDFVDEKQESLILAQTNNLAMVRFSTSAQGINGNIVRLGTDTGIKIQINRSQFTNMRFCKGMLVYRAGPYF